MFTWLRKRFCNAALLGISDAIEILENSKPREELPEMPPSLAARLALPAPEVETAKATGRKGRD